MSAPPAAASSSSAPAAAAPRAGEDAPYNWPTLLRILVELDISQNPVPRATIVNLWIQKHGASSKALRNATVTKFIVDGKLRGSASYLQLATGPEVAFPDGEALIVPGDASGGKGKGKKNNNNNDDDDDDPRPFEMPEAIPGLTSGDPILDRIPEAFNLGGRPGVNDCTPRGWGPNILSRKLNPTFLKKYVAFPDPPKGTMSKQELAMQVSRERPPMSTLKKTQLRNCHRVGHVSVTGRSFLFRGTPPYIVDPEGFFAAAKLTTRNPAFVKTACQWLRTVGTEQRRIDARWSYLVEIVIPIYCNGYSSAFPHQLNTGSRYDVPPPISKANNNMTDLSGILVRPWCDWEKMLKESGLVLAVPKQDDDAEEKQCFSGDEKKDDVLALAAEEAAATVVVAAAGKKKQQQQQQQQQQKDVGGEGEGGAASATAIVEKKKDDQDLHPGCGHLNPDHIRNRPYDLNQIFQNFSVTLDPAFDDSKLECFTRCCRCDRVIDLPYPPECVCGAHYCTVDCFDSDLDYHRVICERRLENNMFGLVIAELCVWLTQTHIISQEFYPWNRGDQPLGRETGELDFLTTLNMITDPRKKQKVIQELQQNSH